MDNYKKDVEFLDKERNRAILEVEITHRNGHAEFTMCGDYAGGHGQCIDHIVPANEAQQELINFWKQFHLKSLENEPQFLLQLEDTIARVEAAEDERKGESLESLDDGELCNLITDKLDIVDRDCELVAAFVRVFNLCEDDLSDVDINDTRVTVQGIDYIAGTDDEMDRECEEQLESYVDECVLPDVPENLRFYFDTKKFIDDVMRQDGRASTLNRYDGGEEEATINGTTYYIYRS